VLRCALQQLMLMRILFGFLFDKQKALTLEQVKFSLENFISKRGLVNLILRQIRVRLGENFSLKLGAHF